MKRRLIHSVPAFAAAHFGGALLFGALVSAKAALSGQGSLVELLLGPVIVLFYSFFVMPLTAMLFFPIVLASSTLNLTNKYAFVFLGSIMGLALGWVLSMDGVPFSSWPLGLYALAGAGSGYFAISVLRSSWRRDESGT